MFRIVAGVLLAAPLIAQVRQGNTFSLPLAAGRLEVEFASPSAFRFTRAWSGALPPQPALNSEAITVTQEDVGAFLRLRTRYLTVEIDKTGDSLAVRNTEDKLVLRTGVRRHTLDHPLSPSEHFYGLGAGRGPRLDRRGTIVHAANAFLLSTAGYGEYFPGSGELKFDLAASRPDRWSVTFPGERPEFVFYMGPTPKEILEEHLAFIGPVRQRVARDFAVREKAAPPGSASWESLREAFYSLQWASLRVMLFPEFDLAAFQGADPVLRARAEQVASVTPVVYAGAREGVERRRARWLPHFVSYAAEARDRGVPILRPMALQFPEDLQVRDRTGQVMFGDEVLIAPALDASGRVSVYLPRGVWTDLRSNEVYKGGQEIVVQAAPDEVPAFVRNGSIVPVALPGGAMELHYFPKLAGEYFAYEEAVSDYSQFHAAPSVDEFRLEVESKVDREYRWVVHHLAPCKDVRGADVKSWRYDKDSIYITVLGRAQADQVVHIGF